jgi:hypothetical protein
MVKSINFSHGCSYHSKNYGHYLYHIPRKADIIIGRLIPIRDRSDILYYERNPELIEKEIILTETGDPELGLLVKISRGIVSKRGGATSHVAILGRALKISFVCGGDVSLSDLKNGNLCLLYGDLKLAVFGDSWRYLSHLKNLLWEKGKLEFNQIERVLESRDGSEYKIIKDEGIFIKDKNKWQVYNIQDKVLGMNANNDLKIVRGPDEPLCPKCNAHIKLGFNYKDCQCGQKYHEICYDKLDNCLKCDEDLS